MKFTKMEGLGNDYVYVDLRDETVKDPAAFARMVADRHFGIGSDGLILIGPSEVADARMWMYNADGSRGRMCGNGIRCVGKYVYDHGWTKEKTITVETDAGIKALTLFTDGEDRVASVRVDMGPALFEAGLIPILLSGDEDPQALSFEIGGEEREAVSLSMGNPHLVIFCDEAEDLSLAALGPAFDHPSRFPEGVNTEFVKIIDDHTIRMRVWERGSGETLACGTGACAAAVAGILKGKVKSPVTVRLNGGDLEIEWAREENMVFMTGPAKEVFEGEIHVKSE